MSRVALLRTKLRTPERRPNAVPRGILLSRLQEGLHLDHHLTLVSAPAGFGKTTLLRQWIDLLGRPAAWLTLEEGDDDPPRLAAYLLAALGQEPMPDSEPKEVVQALINRLADSGQEQVLVLDDYHAIRAFPAHDLIAYLIAHQPSCFHLAIATREDPPLPLARLRARDQITEIRERCLRFMPHGVAAFLQDTLHLALPLESVSTLARRTEGWITALQLAGVALSTAADPLSFVSAFAGNDRYIMDYLMEEVLAEQPEHLREFLRETAVLDRLSAELCNAVTGRTDSQSLLEQLEADNLFLTPLDNHREWWRYHTLFAEALRFTLPPAMQRQLHLKAAAWSETAGLPDLALQHARAAVALAPSAPVSKTAPTPQALIEPLSERELEVLQLIAEGLSNQAIASRLIIAEGTVKRHINNIYGKLQVSSRTQAVAVARQLQLLP